MAINTNPTGIFSVAQGSSNTPYTFIKNDTLEVTGTGIYLPFDDLQAYMPSANVLNEAHSDADYRYMLLGISEAHAKHENSLIAEDKPKGFSVQPSEITITTAGAMVKKFVSRFFYNTQELSLKDKE